MPGTRTFLQMNQVEGRRVFVNYDLSGAANAIDPPGDTFDTQIGAPIFKRRPAKPRHPEVTKPRPQ
jgi:hypothetical protein